MNTTKKCPRCGAELQAAERICRFCQAEFTITIQGYCTYCHAIRESDAEQRCVICQHALADVQVLSRLAGEAPPPAPAPPTKTRSQPAAPRQKKPALSRLGFVLTLIGLAIIAWQIGLFDQAAPLIASLQGTTLTPTLTSTPQPTDTPWPTNTPHPTRTPWPTDTATPAPLEVSFDSIDAVEVNNLVILVGRLELMSSTKCTTQGTRTTCGLLLENPANTGQKITIFVEVGDEPNQMKPLPESYAKSDIQVRLDDGSIAVIGYRLRVFGRRCLTTVNTSCITDVYKIELYQLK